MRLVRVYSHRPESDVCVAMADGGRNSSETKEANKVHLLKPAMIEPKRFRLTGLMVHTTLLQGFVSPRRSWLCIDRGRTIHDEK